MHVKLRFCQPMDVLKYSSHPVQFRHEEDTNRWTVINPKDSACLQMTYLPGRDVVLDSV